MHLVTLNRTTWTVKARKRGPRSIRNRKRAKEGKQTVELFIAEMLQLDFLFLAKQGKSGFNSPFSGAALGQPFCCFSAGYVAAVLSSDSAHVSRAVCGAALIPLPAPGASPALLGSGLQPGC